MNEAKYWEIKEKLDAFIREKKLTPGSRLPSEVILAKMFQVSRPTLREYFKVLQREGKITTINGSGTYLLDQNRRIDNQLNDLQGIGRMIREAGYEANQEILSVDFGDPDDDWREALSLREQEDVWILNKIRTADRKPVSVSWSIFPAHIIGNMKFDTEIRQGKYSVFEFLERKRGIYVTSAFTQITALTAADVYESSVRQHLGNEVLKLVQLHFDRNDKKIFLSIDYIRTDMISLNLIRSRKGVYV